MTVPAEIRSIPRYFGLPNSTAKAYFAVQHLLNQNISALFVSRENGEDFNNGALEFIPRGAQVLSFPDTDTGRINALYTLLSPEHPVRLISTSYESLSAPLPSVQEFQRKIRLLHRGESIRRSDLLDLLESYGYTREDYAEAPAQYAVRGSVVDIFCLNNPLPLRLYFSGNRIDTISTFDLDTQNTREHVNEAVILPLLFENTPAVLADYVKDYTFIFDEPDSTFDVTPYPHALITTQLPSAQGTDCQLQANLAFGANMELLTREVARLQQQNIMVTLCCLNRGELDRIGELLADQKIFQTVQFKISPLTQGFIHPQEHFALITSNEILNRRYSTSTTLKRFDVESAKHIRFKELQVGDYVVHQEYGIGRYLGLEVMNQTEKPTDCLIIEYRRGSRLYVPMYDFKKVQKYIGAGGKRPSLSVMGGVTWREVKKRVKEDAQKAAKEILKLEAQRQATPAPEITGDTRIEQEFADSFPYTLTSGQAQAIEETLHDLDLPKPMDRVLVGDVGFGKTEVAMRAAIKVALSGKQVMVVVPTTILADQHYKTFSKRMAGFPVNVRMLCRFQTPKEQKQVIEELKNGLCDIIIGTHRLMSKDIAFKQLGLVIIDEEHRFGVKQKEKIRSMCAGVHSLLLSATPIPRTLNQSLSSLRDISLIDTPPRGRTPIKTIVTAWDNTLVAAAINQELARNGQVYYVYNSVQSMQSRLELLKQLVPQARICMAHGQMDEQQLEQTLWDFNNGKYDVLLASTIIESGIDITNANTLIVENAHNFGLAQLYQLRGRIGRGDIKAYCYLFHPDWLFKKTSQEEDNFADLSAVYLKTSPEKDPTQEARERLSALMEFSDLGSGFRLALRDMEIRGAGDLLGVKQHGHINEVGLSLYCDLVAAEVKKLKGQPVSRQLQAKISLPVASFIPPDYLPDDSERLKFYKEFMSADESKTATLLTRLEDLCGPAPQEVHNLLEIISLSHRAGLLEIYHIDYIQNELELLFTSRFKLPENGLNKLIEHFGLNNLSFIKSKNGDGLRIRVPENKKPLAYTRQTLRVVEQIVMPSKMV